jgi:hypothetical protein
MYMRVPMEASLSGGGLIAENRSGGSEEHFLERSAYWTSFTMNNYSLLAAQAKKVQAAGLVSSLPMILEDAAILRPSIPKSYGCRLQETLECWIEIGLIVLSFHTNQIFQRHAKYIVYLVRASGKAVLSKFRRLLQYDSKGSFQ